MVTTLGESPPFQRPVRYQLEVPILEHRRRGEYEYELILHSPEVADEARPGQFMQILYDDSYNPYSRRPFSVFWTDRTKGTFSIVYLARGVFTEGLRSKQAGQLLSVVGPLGNSYDPNPTRTRTRNRNPNPDRNPDLLHIMAAGGVGAPPLYFLAREMLDDGRWTMDDGRWTIDDGRIVVINGARTKELLVGTQEFGALDVQVISTTDDGSYGKKGVVTDALGELLDESTLPVQVYTCGPTGMLRAVGDMCVNRGVPCQVSVETVMPCGVGVCMGCVVKIRDSSSQGFAYQRSCYEGPVFAAEAVIWD